MSIFRFILFYYFTACFLHATIYEDAEDKNAYRWKQQSKSTSMVHNIRDASKKSRVIEFKGKGTKDAYTLKTLNTTKNEYWLSWEMKFSEDFVIIVLAETNVGKRYLIYTPGIFKGHMQYGLGYETINGKWQTLRRNIQEDIAYFDNRVKVLWLKSFVVKGNGRIDNIITQDTMFGTKKKFVRKGKNSLPVISIEGAKTVQLNLGETYVEEGVSAYDKEDGEISVLSTQSIDSNEAGRYLVLYMVTDSDGNVAMDKRYVDVGKVTIKETKVRLDDIEEDYNDEQIDLTAEEVQIQNWETKLFLRENELAKKEKKSNKN